MRMGRNLDPALAEVAQLLNTKRFAEADEKMRAIEANNEHEAWRLPLVCVILRERIDKEKGTP